MVLVTGGTGLVGSHLLYFLVSEGKKVRAIHRKNSDVKKVEKIFSYFSDVPEELYSRIEWQEADITDIPALTDAFSGITEVYHAAAYISFDPRNYEKLEKANIEGTANVVNLSLDFKIRKLCHISSVATLGKNESSRPINEESNWNPHADNSVYSITKYGAEIEVWRGMQEGLNAVILNPGVILGSGFWGSGTGAFFSKIHHGMPFYTTGKMGFVDVYDVAKIAVILMEQPIREERFVVVAENKSYAYILKTVANSLGKRQPYIKMKPWMLEIAWRLDKLKSILTGSKQSLFKSTAASAARENIFDNSKLKKTLNYTFIPVEETIRSTAANYLKDIS